jgi:putative transcriptional regulator
MEWEMAKKRSERLAVVHETALDFHEAGLIRAQTMREFDNLCLTPVKSFTPQAIASLRRRAHVSQAVFAHHLNVSPTTVSQWERGEKSPSGPSLKLLALADAKGLTAIA